MPSAPAPEASVPTPAAGYGIIPFADAFPMGQNLPIYISLPVGYQYSLLKTQNAHLWSPPAAASELAKGTRPENFLTVQAIRSVTITYNPRMQQFMCGEDCNEAQAIKSFEDENTKVVVSQRYNINGAAVLFLEFNNLKPRANQRKRGYAAFIAGGSNNEAVLVSVRSPLKDEKAAEPAWAELKRVIIESQGVFKR